MSVSVSTYKILCDCVGEYCISLNMPHNAVRWHYKRNSSLSANLVSCVGTFCMCFPTFHKQCASFEMSSAVVGGAGMFNPRLGIQSECDPRLGIRSECAYYSIDNGGILLLCVLVCMCVVYSANKFGCVRTSVHVHARFTCCVHVQHVHACTQLGCGLPLLVLVQCHNLG